MATLAQLWRRFVARPEPPGPQPFEGHGLTRMARRDGSFNTYHYWCRCGEELSRGPSGGCDVNAVCRRCRINYGSLPGFYGD